jgi:hypothetical protein
MQIVAALSCETFQAGMKRQDTGEARRLVIDHRKRSGGSRKTSNSNADVRNIAIEALSEGEALARRTGLSGAT